MLRLVFRSNFNILLYNFAVQCIVRSPNPHLSVGKQTDYETMKLKAIYDCNLQLYLQLQWNI